MRGGKLENCLWNGVVVGGLQPDHKMDVPVSPKRVLTIQNSVRILQPDYERGMGAEVRHFFSPMEVHDGEEDARPAREANHNQGRSKCRCIIAGRQLMSHGEVAGGGCVVY